MFNSKAYVELAKKIGKRASVIMVTFNRWMLTEQSLISIFKNTYLPHTFTVVDNASWDQTREKLKHLKRKGKIDKLILLPKNLGIGKGKNYGLKTWEGKADWHCCIDNDIVVSPYWLAYLCYTSTLRGLGVVGANVQGFGTKHKWFIPTLWKIVNGVVLDNCPNPGGIYVMSASTFRKLGYFHEWSVYGLEDSELHSRQIHHKIRSAYVRNVDCTELEDVQFLMKNGLSYRDFKWNTHNAAVAKLKKQGKPCFSSIKHYETTVSLKQIEAYTYRG